MSGQRGRSPMMGEWRSHPAAAILLTAMLVASCVLPGRRRPESPPPRQSPARDTLLAADRARADSLARLGPVETMRQFLDSQVVYLHPGAPIVYGADNAVALMRAGSPRLGAVTAWQSLGGGVSRDTSSGFTYGIAVRSISGRATPLVERYLAFWGRQRGQPWRILAYVDISTLTAPWPGGAGTTTQLPRFGGARRDALRQMMTTDSSLADRASVFGAARAARDAMADEGVLLTPAELVVGAPAASDYYETRRDLSLSWTPRDGFVAVSGDLGLTVGESLATSRGPTGAVTQSFSKYLSVWRKEPDGRWRIVASGSNARPNPIGD
ncbi:MAG TPA: DUF4440 domain-containing protein [Gemmatimonadaceae bacterium]|nr:DUF4440 domain-containing protein [Gemmatimonadaceae bacterium]